MGDEDDVVFCDDCGDIFLSKVDLDLHTRTIHSVSLTFHHMVGLSPPPPLDQSYQVVYQIALKLSFYLHPHIYNFLYHCTSW